MIEVERLTKHYGPVRALDGVDFKVQSGEIVGLLGPNGAGKSTTMKILTTYIAPDGGRVSVEGYDVAVRSLEVRRLLGYLPEDTPLYGDMKVEDYLVFMARARQLDPARLRERLDYVRSRCGIAPVMKKTISTLSKGYRQRVGLAQALIHDPQILILDEPTSGLDPNQILEIRDVIREVGRQRTVILSTHILQEVLAVCSRALIIHRGKIRADGRLEDLVRETTRGHYLARIGGSPADVVTGDLRSDPAVADVAVELEEAANGYPLYRITPRDPRARIGERIYELVSARGWKLAELRPEEQTLEHVFHQLTMTS